MSLEEEKLVEKNIQKTGVECSTSPERAKSVEKNVHRTGVDHAANKEVSPEHVKENVYRTGVDHATNNKASPEGGMLEATKILCDEVLSANSGELRTTSKKAPLDPVAKLSFYYPQRCILKVYPLMQGLKKQLQKITMMLYRIKLVSLEKTAQVLLYQ